MNQEKQWHKMIYNEIQSYKQINIDIGIGLNQVDDLKPSKYFYKAISQSKTYNDIEKKLKDYYDKQDLNNPQIHAEKECDLVSTRIARIIEENHFQMSPAALKIIHRKLFSGVFHQISEKYVGNFRDYNIEKEEPILCGESVSYGQYDEIIEYLNYDFEIEAKKIMPSF